nr:MupG family TIM beta-alpha barrel fold protein [Globicatella sulfidifaciens]
MVNFGFSIYPENHSVKETEQYMDLLKKYGATRIFI